MTEVEFTEQDQYGQCHPIETPELIEEKMKLFVSAIGDIPPMDKENLILAESNCPQLLTDDFKLQFLRCEVFNEKLAAKRYVKYWDKRVEIFGPEKAFTPLTFQAANSEDRIAFDHGVIRLMAPNVRDPSGRSIVFFDPSRQDKTKYATESMARVMWYIFHSALNENESAQQKGIIMLAYTGKAKFAQFNRDLASHIAGSIKGCLPVRLSAFHICHPPTFFRIIFPIVKVFLGDRLRKRVRVHAGSDEAVAKDLEKFGLTKDVLPTDLGGIVKLDHKKWLDERIAIEK